ncbi:MAG: thiamine diphosphokinase [Lachnospiraceae bacterium]|nr:thiamine diphosphokinase [Lachnospiraceae bacterium]
MEKTDAEYKQAILIGASPMGKEAEQLLSLLKWVGYEIEENKKENSAEMTKETLACHHKCSSCPKACKENGLKKDVYVIAADGGLKFLLDHHMRPDFWIGDLDSLSGGDDELPTDFWNEINRIEHEKVPVEKDDTDMALAVAKAYELGYTDMMLYGGYGGARVSHTLANIQLMHHYAKKGCNIRMMGDGIRMEVLWHGCKRFSAAMTGDLSVICLSDKADMVKIQGLKYEYEGSLTSEVALGISNSFIGQDALIEVHDGALLLVYEKA